MSRSIWNLIMQLCDWFHTFYSVKTPTDVKCSCAQVKSSKLSPVGLVWLNPSISQDSLVNVSHQKHGLFQILFTWYMLYLLKLFELLPVNCFIYLFKEFLEPVLWKSLNSCCFHSIKYSITFWFQKREKVYRLTLLKSHWNWIISPGVAQHEECLRMGEPDIRSS